jgi:hypothetical protein
MSETTLQKRFDDLTERVARKHAELVAIEAELGGLISRLVDAPEKARAALIARRAELVNLADVLRDELQELNNRKDAAYLAIFEYRESEAKSKLENLAAQQLEQRKALEKLDRTLLHFMNRGGRTPETKDSARELLRLNTDQATAKAELQIATRHTTLARLAYEKAKVEAEQVRQSVGR